MVRVISVFLLVRSSEHQEMVRLYVLPRWKERVAWFKKQTGPDDKCQYMMCEGQAMACCWTATSRLVNSKTSSTGPQTVDDGRSIPFHLSDRGMRPCPACPSTVAGDRRRFLRWLDRSLKRTPGPYGFGFWVWGLVRGLNRCHATLGQMICLPSGNPHYMGPAFGRNSITKTQCRVGSDSTLSLQLWLSRDQLLHSKSVRPVAVIPYYCCSYHDHNNS